MFNQTKRFMWMYSDILKETPEKAEHFLNWYIGNYYENKYYKKEALIMPMIDKKDILNELDLDDVLGKYGKYKSFKLNKKVLEITSKDHKLFLALADVFDDVIDTKDKIYVYDFDIKKLK